ncbi:hypothetical protein HID58_042427 [Brassica napus]|uniref:BnaC01g23570D protein n=5 Tax=Brassica TaxID=3705 RepID=A0A078FU10_BRANA|nr:hypothetical protein HID58_042427 [Brassica napus]CDY16322.1 BnaC01g23570D [Brassica napus]VDD50484.1 unnamed protein product [Brassica oleracea]
MALFSPFDLFGVTLGGFVYLLDGDNLLPKIARRSGGHAFPLFRALIPENLGFAGLVSGVVLTPPA